MNELAFLPLAMFAGAVDSGLAGLSFSAVAWTIVLHAYPPQVAVPLMIAYSIAAKSQH